MGQLTPEDKWSTLGTMTSTTTSTLEQQMATTRRVSDAIDRAGIIVVGRRRGEADRRMASYRLAMLVTPDTLNPDCAPWVVDIEHYRGERYASHVKCRRCGHRLKINQRAWQWRHQRACGEAR